MAFSGTNLATMEQTRIQALKNAGYNPDGTPIKKSSQEKVAPIAEKIKKKKGEGKKENKKDKKPRTYLP